MLLNAHIFTEMVTLMELERVLYFGVEIVLFFLSFMTQTSLFPPKCETKRTYMSNKYCIQKIFCAVQIIFVFNERIFSNYYKMTLRINFKFYST